MTNIDYEKLLTSQDKIIFRVLFLAILILSPLGVLYVNFNNVIKSVEPFYMLVILIVLFTPLILVAQINYFKKLNNLRNSIKMLEPILNKLKFYWEDLAKYQRKFATEFSELINDPDWDLSSKNRIELKHLNLLEELKSKISGINELKEECSFIEKNYLNDILYTSVKILYTISIILTMINIFLFPLTLKLFLVLLYGLYSLYFIIDFMIYTPENKSEVKKYIKIYNDRYKSYIETKNFYLRAEKMLPEFKRFKEEMKGLNSKSIKYKTAEKKHNNIVKQIESKLKLIEFEK